MYGFMYEHLSNHQDSQYDFHSGGSTVTVLLSVTEEWFSSLEHTVFFDHQKAFDSVPHRSLLKKTFALVATYCAWSLTVKLAAPKLL